MKRHLKIARMWVLALLLAVAFSAAHAQDTSSIKTALESKEFVFKAETALPTSGAARHLTGENYVVRVSGDSLVSYLPYFGRAYVAPVGSEAGIKFTSTRFDYVVKGRRKGGWDVVLRPKDVSTVRELDLTIGDDGYASLRTLSNDRQPIAFNGTVQALK